MSRRYGWVHRIWRRLFQKVRGDGIAVGVEPGPASLLDNYTSTGYPVRQDEALSTSPALDGGFRLAWPIEAVTASATITAFALTQTYFPPVIYDTPFQQNGQTGANYHEDLTAAADVTGFSLAQTNFPATLYDRTYQRSGQTSADYHEDVTASADITGFDLAQTDFPNPLYDIAYQRIGQLSSDYHEDLVITADVTNFSLEQTA
ncbi:MAG: hypothetical protein EPN60_05255 [Nevskiaceae bacterium]|nr:MAG: hypothetical protein EPN60_05255 [Nevskiaceae bacterium]